MTKYTSCRGKEETSSSQAVHARDGMDKVQVSTRRQELKWAIPRLLLGQAPTLGISGPVSGNREYVSLSLSNVTSGRRAVEIRRFNRKAKQTMAKLASNATSNKTQEMD